MAETHALVSTHVDKNRLF
ncbi:hypothetical protein F383_09690 [Gossypium arboreum]|uniref:Uncharacterized protein n=1 Tax=Gossypium arboreum TaxID=29729 RepID=A0A0B0NPL2_GOSAR|nr:hypothetical protein F383_09690 [Gossypium arboreum]